MYTQEDIDNAKQVLRDSGYIVDYLWHVDDIKNRYETDDGCELDDDEARNILINALDNEIVFDSIWHTIDDEALNEYRLKEDLE